MLFGSKGVVGLDIGSSLVKVVQLRRGSKGIELERFGVAQIYPGGDKGNMSIDPSKAKVDAIKRALADARITSKQVLSAVGGEPVIARYIQMHAMPEAELRNALQWEAEGYIPYEIDEVNLDSVILGPSSDGTNKVDVVLVAAKKDLIEDHLRMLRMADITTSCIDVTSFAFLNQFEYNARPSPEEVIALIDIGAVTTSISIFRGGVSRFSRDISIAGDTITNSVATKLNITFAQAEQMKMQIGAPTTSDATRQALADTRKAVTAGGGSDLLERIRGTVERITGEDLGDNSPDAMAQKAIKATMGTLVSEIRRSLQYFENQTSGVKVSRVALGGGTSRLKNIDTFFQNELNLPTTLVDPLARIGIKSKEVDPAQLAENKAHLSVAVGLAIRQLTN